MKTDFSQFLKGSDILKRGFARMQQGGVITVSYTHLTLPTIQPV